MVANSDYATGFRVGSADWNSNSNSMQQLDVGKVPVGAELGSPKTSSGYDSAVRIL